MERYWFWRIWSVSSYRFVLWTKHPVLTHWLLGIPPSTNAWFVQCCLYVGLMVIVKILITLLIQMEFWEDVRDFIFTPVTNADVELVLVMVIIPFFVNVSHKEISWKSSWPGLVSNISEPATGSVDLTQQNQLISHTRISWFCLVRTTGSLWGEICLDRSVKCP